MQLKYLIVGTGRCGTVFLAKVFNELGVPCGHETIFNYEPWETIQKRLAGQTGLSLSYTSTHRKTEGQWASDPWNCDLINLVADSSWMAVPHLSKFPEAKILHVVRNPLRVIRSYVEDLGFFRSAKPQNLYEEFAYQYIPDLRQELTAYDRCAVFFVEWNALIPNAYVHRIEDGLQGVYEFLGSSGEVNIPKNTNSYRSNQPDSAISLIKLSPAIRERLIQSSSEFGYHFDLL